MGMDDEYFKDEYIKINNNTENVSYKLLYKFISLYNHHFTIL